MEGLTQLHERGIGGHERLILVKALNTALVEMKHPITVGQELIVSDELCDTRQGHKGGT